MGSIAKAQNQIENHPGKVNGIVRDTPDASVPGALISFETRLDGNKFKRKVESNGDGVFEVELPAGIYRVTVRFSGYRTFQRKELVIEAGKTLSLDIVLKENRRKITTIAE